MTCDSPNFEGVLDDVRCGSSTTVPSTRRKRAIDDSIFEFSIGFDLDGVEEFNTTTDVPWLEANSRMFVKPNPTISDFSGDRIKVVENLNAQLEIKGENLDSGKYYFKLNHFNFNINSQNLSVGANDVV